MEELNKLKQKRAIENLRKSCINADIALNKEQSKQFTNHLIDEIGKITGIPKYLLTNKNKENMKTKTFEDCMYVSGSREKLKNLIDYAIKKEVPMFDRVYNRDLELYEDCLVFIDDKLALYFTHNILENSSFTNITADQFFEYCDNWQKLKQPELKPGQWRKDLDGDLFRIKEFEKVMDVSTLDSTEKEYLQTNWIFTDNPSEKLHINSINNELPTNEEIKEHLTKIAREKSFPVNVKIDRENLNISSVFNKVIIGNNEIHYYPPNDSFSINGKIIYQKGVWAEIID